MEGQEEVEQGSERLCKWDMKSCGGELAVLDAIWGTLERLCEQGVEVEPYDGELAVLSAVSEVPEPLGEEV